MELFDDPSERSPELEHAFSAFPTPICTWKPVVLFVSILYPKDSTSASASSNARISPTQSSSPRSLKTLEASSMLSFV